MKRLVLFVLLLGCLTCNAQTFCHTPQVSNESHDRGLKLHLKKSRTTSSNSPYWLRVYIHVIRKSDGTGGHGYQNVQSALDTLNSDFNPHDIYFVWNGTIDYIDDTYRYYHPSDSVFSVNNHADGIDIYLFPDEVEKGDGGQANGIGVSSELYVGGKYWKTPYPSIIPSHVLSHEMGHVLYLWHTHHGTWPETGDPGQCKELVDGSNSDCCGDYVEDTPADPFLNFDVDPITYQWNGSGYDQNGDPYAPDTRQIMSYTDIRCMSHFSPGQVERMHAAIESLSFLQSASIALSINGSSIPCGTEIYRIENLPYGFYTIWSWKGDSSLPIVQGPSSTNQCSITNDNHAYINDTLVATIYKNGNVVRTLEKAINTGCNFTGTYKQAPHNYVHWNYPGQAATPFNDGETFMVFKGTTITLRSDKFVNANITHSGIPALSWTHSGDSVTFFFPYFEPNDPYIQSLVPSNDNAMTVDVVNSTCEHSRFYIMGSSPLNPTMLSPNVQMNRQGQSLIFSRNDAEANSEISSVETEPKGWTLTIANLATGQTMYQSRTDNDKLGVFIRDWPTGIYVATIQVGKSSTTLKFKL